MVKISKMFFKKIKFNEYFLILSFGLFVFLTQFYSIGVEVINWDESDFILMGSSFYNGNLPYVEVWDLKPPLHFFYLGTVFKLFSPSLLTARLAGDFLIFITSIFLYFISKKIFRNYEAVMVSLLYISLVSFEFAQPTMTEYLSTLFVIVGMIFYENNNSKSIFASGLLITLAIFTRTNTAFVWMFFILYSVFVKNRRVNLKYYILGSGVPVIILSSLYFAEGKIIEFYYSVFLIPLGNTLIRENIVEVFMSSYKGIFVDNIFSIPTFFLIFLILFSLSLLNPKFRSQLFEGLPLINLYVYVFLSLAISILVGGRFYYHYLIQLFPFLSIFIIFAISKILNSNNAAYLFLILLITFNSFSLITQSIYNIQNYQNIKQNYKLQKISKLIDANEELLALDNHLVYLYLDKQPLTPVVHPNIIFKDDEYELLISSLVKLGYINENQNQIILDSYPKYIICENFCYEYINPIYFENYKLITEIDKVKLFILRG